MFGIRCPMFLIASALPCWAPVSTCAADVAAAAGAHRDRCAGKRLRAPGIAAYHGVSFLEGAELAGIREGSLIPGSGPLPAATRARSRRRHQIGRAHV